MFYDVEFVAEEAPSYPKVDTQTLLRQKIIHDSKTKPTHIKFMTTQNERYYRAQVKLYWCIREEEFEEAMRLVLDGAPPTYNTSGGSTLFLAVKKRKYTLIKIMLQHPHVKSVINGTPSSWAPFPTAVVLGEINIAKELLSHPDLDVSKVHWQFNTFVLRDIHPNCKRGVRSQMIDIVRQYFDLRIARGYPSPSFKEFKNSTDPNCYCMIS
jgi:hypothetical protein